MRVQISSGRGPAECELAAGMYLEFFLQKYPEAVIIRHHGGWAYKMDGRRITAYKSVLLELPDSLKVDLGAVKWACPSPIRPRHSRKNWFIEVSGLNETGIEKKISQEFDPDHPDKSLIKIETFHSPGKGGQNVNKVETGVRVIHLPTGLAASSVTARTQARNRKLALERLLDIILSHNLRRDRQLAEAGRQLHDQLERGNPFITFTGRDFKPL